jgi:hypothetical protein
VATVKGTKPGTRAVTGRPTKPGGEREAARTGTAQARNAKVKSVGDAAVESFRRSVGGGSQSTDSNQ